MPSLKHLFVSLLRNIFSMQKSKLENASENFDWREPFTVESCHGGVL